MPHKLYSYCLRYDDGAAPNPFWDCCTLVICKPKIRRTAQVGDWIVGLGSTNSPIGDVSDGVVYAMKVTEKMTIRDYDEYCQESLIQKIPDWQNRSDYRRRVGDCIYNYSHRESPKLRPSVHNDSNRERDLGGEFALLSTHFFYFGDRPVKLPNFLKPIIHSTQGHKSRSNQPYFEKFVEWINQFELNKLLGEPQLILSLSDGDDVCAKCAARDLEDADEDEKCSE
jgi:hypothetical protein